MANRDDDRLLDRWRTEARRAMPSADDDLIDEVAGFLAERWRQTSEAGAGPAQADAQAYADLAEWRGRRAPRRHSVVHRTSQWIGLGTDLRDAARALRVRPLFTVGATLLSSIAVAAVVSAAALLYGVLWRPLPYPEPGRLAVIWEVTRGRPVQISYPDYQDVASAAVFDGRAAMSGGRGSLRVGDTIHRINLLEIEAAGYALLGARPSLGRLLSEADADRPFALISHRLWTTVLNSDPAVLGRQLWLSGRTLTVVGVLEPGFDFELPVPPGFRLEKNDIWMVLERDSPFVARRDVSGYEALVRLAPGRTLDEAQAAASAIGERLAADHPATNAGRGFRVAALHDEVVAGIRRPLGLVGVAAAVALLVALANLVVLGLVRGADRQTELAIRQALGAGSFRLRRQLAVEGALIAASGGLVGVLLGSHFVRWLASSESTRLPRPDAIALDAPVLVIAGCATLLVAAVLALQPLPVPTSALRAGARLTSAGSRRARRLMVTAEVALALVLATGGAMLALSFGRLLAVDAGFEPHGVATARISAFGNRYPSRAATVTFIDDIVERLRLLPGVTSAAAGYSLPLSGQLTGTAVVAEGQPSQTGPAPAAGWQFVTPGYFETLGIPRLRGRDFTSDDFTRRGHVVIVNEQLARLLFPGQDPVGRRIGVGGGETEGDWHEIVGVVGDVRHQALDVEPAPRVYDLFGQHFERTLYVMARSSQADAGPLVTTIRRIVYEVDPEAPVFELATLSSLVDRSAAPRRLATVVAMGLAAIAVVLALIGVYGVAAAAAAERTREIGVRAALGASPRSLFGLIAREGGRAAIGGGMLGLAGSMVIVRLLHAQLFGVSPADAFWILPLVAAALLGSMALAVVPPALRAASVDPLTAIRTE